MADKPKQDMDALQKEAERLLKELAKIVEQAAKNTPPPKKEKTK